MANITEIKREKMLNYINQLKLLHNDDNSITALNEIYNHLSDKKFGLIFEEHTEEADEKLKDYIPVLCEDKSRIVKSSEDLPYNFLIEGDNLHALHLLEKTHKGKVDCIYIDPPYNTGASDWKYNNDYVDKTDKYPHSKWLSMMKTRLQLAKKILNPKTGVMIITIDEHEVHHLRTLVEELFVNCYVQMVTIIINPKGVARGKFARVEENALFVFMPESKICSWKDNMLTEVAKTKKVRWASLLRSGTDARRIDNKSLFYPVLVDSHNRKVIKALNPLLPLDLHPNLNEKIDGYDVAWPIRKDLTEGRWMLSPETLNKLIDLGYVTLGKFDEKRNTWPISYLNEKTRSQIDSGEIVISGYDSSGSVQIEFVGEKNHEVRTVWYRALHNAGNYGTDLITNILGKSGSFTFPKSIYAVRDCIGLIVKDNPNAIVVDFFAGSGTTMHAVNLLNYEDDGKRTCILVTNNECSSEDEKKYKKLHNLEVIDKNSITWKKYEDEHGIARSVTWNRVKNSIKGCREDGTLIPGELELISTTEIGAKRNYKKLIFTLNDYKERKSYLDSLGKEVVKSNLLKKDESFIISPDTNFAALFDENDFELFKNELINCENIKNIYIFSKNNKKYTEMCKVLENDLEQCFEVINKKHIISEGFVSNVKYLKCDWVDRRPGNYLLSNALSLHVKEMIELQNFIDLDNKKYILILNRNDFNKYIVNNENKDIIEKVWVNQNIVFDYEEIKELKKYKFKYIPKEFFGQELKEVAE